MMHDTRSAHAPDDGFTLIELLVVVLIMGVLAAMAVPSYLGLAATVQEASTQSDLGSDRTALVAYGIDNNGVLPSAATFNPRASGSNLVGYGWQQGPETTSYRYYTSADRMSWCLEMTSVTGSVFRISGNQATKKETCAALGATNY